MAALGGLYCRRLYCQRLPFGWPHSGSRSHPHCSPKRSALSASLSERPRPRRRSDLRCITHPGPELIRRANRTWPVGWPSVAIDARARRVQRRLRASKRSSGHNSRTGINRVGGYLLPVHGRWRRMTERGRFDPFDVATKNFEVLSISAGNGRRYACATSPTRTSAWSTTS